MSWFGNDDLEWYEMYHKYITERRARRALLSLVGNLMGRAKKP